MIGEGSGITIGLAFVIGAAIAALWWRIEGRIATEQAERKKQLDVERGERKALEKDIADYKLHVERHFASRTILEQTENRLIVAVEKLSGRVETLIGRMETVAVGLAKLSDKD